jgi:hypothetical protein
MPRATFADRLLADRALSPLLERVEHEETAPPVRRSLEVGAADDRAESEADAVAAQVLARIGGSAEESAVDCGVHAGGADVHRSHSDAAGPIGAAGGALDDGSTAAIESARGGGSPLEDGVRREMESGFGRSLDDVRVHTDSRADELSRQMSARAFTTGSDIFFARGEYDPASPAGRQTLAHELAHVVQQRAGVHRKLRGTAEALFSQGEGQTSGKLRKMVGWLTNWDKIVASVRQYEAEESKLLGSGANPDKMTLSSAKPGMLKLLKRAQDAIKEWKKSNDHENQTELGEKKAKKARDESEEVTDSRTKAGRRQAIAMLGPRVGNEMSLLSSKDGSAWLASLGLSTKQVASTGASKSGQMNTVSKLDYKTESGEFSGYFKEDKGVNKSLLSHEEEVGITATDPNYGARAVALYRLDQLFDANVTARAEFAVHTNKQGKSVMGTVLEAAQGTEGAELAYRLDDDPDNPATVSLDDPVLQRGLNKLQLLDAISGQLDRHQGNYYVASDEQGNVTGVTGIDLDMAFGSKMTSTAKPDGAMNYKGLPEFIDQQMGEKILQVKPADIRAALLGLLPGPEIEATVSRFVEVQEAVLAAKKAGKLVAKWDPNTAKAGSKAGSRYEDATTYQEQAREGWYGQLHKSANQELKDGLSHHFRTLPGWGDMPDKFYTLVSKAAKVDRMWKDKSSSPAVQVVADYLYEHHLSERHIGAMMDLVVPGMLRSLDENSIAVELQECGSAIEEVKLQEKVELLLNAYLAGQYKSLEGRFAAITGKR